MKMPNPFGRVAALTGFSPRQVVTVVAVIALGVALYPVGTKAAGSLVTLVDSTTSNQSRVTGGNVHVTVAGPVATTANVPVPGTFLQGFTISGRSPINPMFPGPEPFSGNRRIALSSLTISNVSATSTEVSVREYQPGSSGDCTTEIPGGVNLVDPVVPANSTVQLTFPQPLMAGYGTMPTVPDYCLGYANFGNVTVLAIGL